MAQQTEPGQLDTSSYPQNAQICYSSMRRGGDGQGSRGVGGIVICPEGYSWCMKEVRSGIEGGRGGFALEV